MFNVSNVYRLHVRSIQLVIQVQSGMNGDLPRVVFGGTLLVCRPSKYCANICAAIGGVLYILDRVSDR